MKTDADEEHGCVTCGALYVEHRNDGMGECPECVDRDQRCDSCGGGGAVLAPHTGRILCDPCFGALLNRGRQR